MERPPDPEPAPEQPGAPDSVTRGFLFSDLRAYTDYVETHGAARAASLLDRYRTLVRAAIKRFGGAEIKTEGDSFYVVFNSVSSAVRCGLVITGNALLDAAEHPDELIKVGIGYTQARRSRRRRDTSGRPSTSPHGSAPRPARTRCSSARPSGR
jgi:class 3 adenylate cyclase